MAEPIFVRAQPFNGSGTAAPFNGSGTAARPRTRGLRLLYAASPMSAWRILRHVLPPSCLWLGVLMGGQKGKCLGVAQYCVDYENSEYYCGNRRPAEEFGEEVRYRKNREENHRERVLREGFSQVAAQQRMEGAQGSASRAVEACQRVCRARRKNRRRRRIENTERREQKNSSRRDERVEYFVGNPEHFYLLTAEYASNRSLSPSFQSAAKHRKINAAFIMVDGTSPQIPQRLASATSRPALSRLPDASSATALSAFASPHRAK